jgi:hypothetical protein
MGKYFPSRRKFNGKTYDLRRQVDTKSQAKSDAIDLRLHGRAVRIVPAKMIGGRRVYLLYTRFK